MPDGYNIPCQQTQIEVNRLWMETGTSGFKELLVPCTYRYACQAIFRFNRYGDGGPVFASDMVGDCLLLQQLENQLHAD